MHYEIIETQHLLLKSLTPEAMKHIFETYPKEEIKTLLGHRSEEAYQKEAYKQANGYASYNRRFILFLLIDKATGTIIGRGGLHNWNVEDRRAEIGYIMEAEHRRKGLMSEAVEALLEYGFTKMNLNRLEALVDVGNAPSRRLMEKFNFIQEGLLRQHSCAEGGFEDAIIFSKLYQEYVDERKERSNGQE